MNLEVVNGELHGIGSLDEDSTLDPNISLEPGTVVFDLAKASSVNSIGIRTWVTWVGEMSKKYQFVFRHVPQAFILQMNMVNGFLPDNAKIESFYVPVFNEETDEERDLLLKSGYDIAIENGETIIKFDLEERAGAGWELDIIGLDYFQFLKK